ncbi:hypothetical protein CN387_17460 [Bacillus cereus]|nr:hypothetical protein CN387_17460 [Bacillus cereus]PFW30363.1 hypothetical protein COL07_09420 [Bacillus cereus]
MSEKNILVVPMEVEALVFSAYERVHQPFHRYTLNFDNLKDFISPEPKPFTGMDDDFNQNTDNEGIYLHWSIPNAFQKAEENSKGDLQHPIVPNRWLVIRINHSVKEQNLTAWVVESDTLNTSNGSPYYKESGEHGATCNQDSDSIGPTLIGKKILANEWKETHETCEMFLTAYSTGDPMFTAYQPSCKNVFSIHDCLVGIEEAELDYIVIGWFSNVKYDPLHNLNSIENFNSIMKEHGWKVDDSTCIATSTFISGSINNVKWKRKYDNSRPPKEENPNQNVTVGLTSTDAMCELLGSYATDENQLLITKLLESFQYDLLQSYGELGEEERLDDRIHKSGYGAKMGGFFWKVVEREKQQDITGNVKYGEKEKQYEGNVLAKLNKNQKELDKCMRKLKSLQQQLYEAWWKEEYSCIWMECDSFRSTDLYNDISLLNIKLNDLLKMVPHGNTQEELEKSISEYEKLHRIPTNRQLKRLPMPGFYIPTDPVVMISGFQESLSKPNREELLCHFADKDLPKKNPFSTLNFKNFPIGIKKVLQDSTNELKIWKQPWQPLFIEWQIDWHPLSYHQKGNWSFDGFDIQCNIEPSISSVPQIIEGRTILDSHAVFSLQSRLQQYAKDHNQDSPEVKSFISKLDQCDVLSQSLGGLRQSLLLHSQLMHPMPVGNYEDYIANQVESFPESRGLLDLEGTLFHPIQSGHLLLKRLKIIDRFGQAKEVQLWKNQLITESLRTKNQLNNVIEFKPRVGQGIRLNFNLVSAKNKKNATNVDPVCAWILPNYLDRGLSVYNPEGTLLGEVRLTGRLEDSPKAAWESAPNNPHKDYKYLKDEYHQLYLFLDGLITKGGRALQDFMQGIDQILWIKNPKGQSFDQSLSVMIGRPLMLVRSKLSLELNGRPILHPLSDPTRKPDYLKTKFQVGLGNIHQPEEEGLVGYYLGENYSQFYSVYKDDRADSGYIQMIGKPDTNGEEAYVQLSLDESEQYLTLLVDPEKSVQAYSGIVPLVELEILEQFRRDAFQRMEVIFHVGPILTSVLKRSEGPNEIVLLSPSEKQGEWQWMERSNKDPDNKWETYNLAASDEKDLPTRLPPTIREGVLKLKIEE